MSEIPKDQHADQPRADPGPFDYSFHLLDKADSLCGVNFCEAALVTAQSACEVSFERAFAHHLRKRGLTFLQCPFNKLLKYTLTDPRTAAIYEGLSDDAIRKQPFWPRYTELVKRRNRVVHRGESVTLDEAKSFLETAWSVVTHLRRVAGLTDRPAERKP